MITIKRHSPITSAGSHAVEQLVLCWDTEIIHRQLEKTQKLLVLCVLVSRVPNPALLPNATCSQLGNLPATAWLLWWRQTRAAPRLSHQRHNPPAAGQSQRNTFTNTNITQIQIQKQAINLTLLQWTTLELKNRNDIGQGGFPAFKLVTTELISQENMSCSPILATMSYISYIYISLYFFFIYILYWPVVLPGC